MTYFDAVVRTFKSGVQVDIKRDVLFKLCRSDDQWGNLANPHVDELLPSTQFHAVRVIRYRDSDDDPMVVVAASTDTGVVAIGWFSTEQVILRERCGVVEITKTLADAARSYEARLIAVQNKVEAVLGKMPEDDERDGEVWAVDAALAEIEKHRLFLKELALPNNRDHEKRMELLGLPKDANLGKVLRDEGR